MTPYQMERTNEMVGIANGTQTIFSGAATAASKMALGTSAIFGVVGLLPTIGMNAYQSIVTGRIMPSQYLDVGISIAHMAGFMALAFFSSPVLLPLIGSASIVAGLSYGLFRAGWGQKFDNYFNGLFK